MPRATGTTSELTRYELAWEAINRMIRQGGSWSGFERNCFFAGRSNGSFINVSAAAQLDFDDDGRAAAVWDYDDDGDPDLVLKNRSAPQLRILRNESASSFARSRVTLEGRRSNRDAIGARVTLVAGSRTWVREVRAGSGFLSQNSTRLLFGLGTASRIEALTVTWPSGGRQVFRDLPVDRALHIVEGLDPKITAFAAQRSLPSPLLSSSPGSEPRSSPTPGRRVWLLEPLALDLGAVVRDEGTGLRAETDGTKGLPRNPRFPVAVALWSPSCAVCVRELGKWGEYEQADVPIVAWAPVEADRESEVAAIARRVKVPVRRVDPRAVRAWAVAIEHAVRWSRDLAVPTTLLFDRSGRVVRLYQGPVSRDEIDADSRRWASLDAKGREQLGLPFPGHYVVHEVDRSPFRLGLAFLEEGYPSLARRAFEESLDRSLENDQVDPDSLYNIGVIDLGLERLEDARASFQRALEAVPDFVDAHVNLGVTLARQRRLDGAEEAFSKGSGDPARPFRGARQSREPLRPARRLGPRAHGSREGGSGGASLARSLENDRHDRAARRETRGSDAGLRATRAARAGAAGSLESARGRSGRARSPRRCGRVVRAGDRDRSSLCVGAQQLRPHPVRARSDRGGGDVVPHGHRARPRSLDTLSQLGPHAAR